MKVEVRTLTDIIDTDLREFSMYTIESRAIPSVIDGMKPTQRKLLYAMITEYKGNKVKVAELGGGLAKMNYHHGEGSAQGAAVGMASDWNNNAPIFTGHGNFGSRLVQEAAAPRYIFASLSDTFKKFFIDTEVAPKAFDLENPEPAFYLPIIPWVLVNGISGIAVGFKTDILPRSIPSLIEATANCLKSPEKFLKANDVIMPKFPSFKGTVEHVSENQYRTIGCIEYLGKFTYAITELPIGFDRASYVEFLNGLIDKDMIKDYDDTCSKDGFGFEIKVTAQQRNAIDKDMFKYFKLVRLHTEILTTLGYDGKLKIFESVAQLIHYFVQYRITKFGDKIAYDINETNEALDEMIHRAKFITAVIERKVDFRTNTKVQLLEFIAKKITPKDFGKKFVNIPLYECTTDEAAKLEAKIADKNKILEMLKKQTPMSVYKAHLAKI